ncbi:MAG: hypothetical protein ABI353_08840 [Isosphaeraceae bacterium]
MERIEKRRAFLGRALALLSGLAVIPTIAQDAEAAPPRFRGGRGGGYGYGRRPNVYRGGWGGSGGYGRSYYGGYRGYGGYGRPYSGGYGGYRAPFVQPFGGPIYRPAPRMYGGPGYFPPML